VEGARSRLCKMGDGVYRAMDAKWMTSFFKVYFQQ
jgi:hypothetical protein